MGAINEFILTFDVDWAPDYMINSTINFLSAYNIRSTWFITHESQATKNLLRNDLVEIGIHPNFSQSSTQGSSAKNIMDNLTKAFPSARAVRTHAMVYSAKMAKAFTHYGLLIDSSIYLGGMANIQPFITNYSDGKKIIRMPYFWSDDGELSYKPRFVVPGAYGMKILCFHPVHVHHNTQRMKDYLRYKQNRGTINNKANVLGVTDYLCTIIRHQQSFRTLSEVAETFYGQE